MSKIAKLLSFVRLTRNEAKVSDVKVDPGGGPNITAEHFAPAGDDSFPLTSDYALINTTPRSGSAAVAGYLDPINEPKAQEGDKRIYARNPEDGSVIAEVWLKNDGTVLISNDNGSAMLRPDGGSILTTPESTFDAAADGSIKGVNNVGGSYELQAGGNFIVNKVTIDLNGNIDTPGNIKAGGTVSAPTVSGSSSVKAAGKELAGHTHPIAWTDPAGSGNSGPNS